MRWNDTKAWSKSQSEFVIKVGKKVDIKVGEGEMCVLYFIVCAIFLHNTAAYNRPTLKQFKHLQ